jgi:glutamate synthase (NADPH/NADH) small chain
MGKPTGFMEFSRETPQRRDVATRLHDYQEVYQPFPELKLLEQGARCMDCGVPFCHTGCPLGNIIPDWNDLVYRGNWAEALRRLHSTNNFPEFTGRLCPAPCEEACVLGINEPPVTIKNIENSIIERGFAEGWVRPEPPETRSGKKVAIIGSGPAGLACAQQLNRAGHWVTVFERADRIGGLLRYGIPEFKMEKKVLDRRLAILEAEGIVFRPSVNVGVDLPVEQLRREYDAVVLAVGATIPRDLPVPGRELQGVHFAMDYLPLQNKTCEGDRIDTRQFISAKDKHVIIIGGGDTGADCLGTAHRQGAAESAGRVDALALLAHGLADQQRPRGGGESRLERRDQEVHRFEWPGRTVARRPAGMVLGRGPHADAGSGRQRIRVARRPGAAGDGFCGAAETRAYRGLGGGAGSPGERQGRRQLHDHSAGRICDR